MTQRYSRLAGCAVVATLLFFFSGAVQAAESKKADPRKGEGDYAKNLTGRLGVGYSNELSQLAIDPTGEAPPVSALSAKYGLSPEMTLQGLLGMIYVNGDHFDAHGFSAGAKLNFNYVRESNLLFYFGGGLGITDYRKNWDHVTTIGQINPTVNTPSDEKVTAFHILGTVGIEYFFPWFPNLGLNFEFSVGLTLGDGYWALGLPNPTGGQHLANVGNFGFHYYLPPF